jgi:hypothetical protein
MATETSGMTTLQITLPSRLVQDAQSAGLLSPDLVERWLRAQLKARNNAEFLAVLDRLDAVDSQDYMSPEDVAEEIRAMRAEKRASLSA